MSATRHPESKKGSEAPHKGAVRRIKAVLEAESVIEGAGLPVRRSFPTKKVDHVDPFLLLDHLGPVRWAPGEAAGAPEHPHRGYEILTYLLEGAICHSDTTGEEGVLGPGDVQWLTVGAGLSHSEMPHPDMRRTGGVLHGVQLWVNLSRRDKMMPPRYQRFSADRVPLVREEGASVRVLVGSALGVRSGIETGASVTVLHVGLEPGAKIELPVAASHVSLAYVLSGAALFGLDGPELSEGTMQRFEMEGDRALLASSNDADRMSDILLMTGEPLREPVSKGGPFVMNTRDEILQAFEDHRLGRLGGRG